MSGKSHFFQAEGHSLGRSAVRTCNNHDNHDIHNLIIVQFL